ncbi:unnamed protein product [Acanthoscelides obtectus]|uniref:Uncharacterized protein n=1 Tax=Acanthoscelides obtectus TaxID=200917 RepID=A0A9P0QEZ7_ACAOB|nr:unnamed protein product [Acanthoscelides obtectus]CAK1688463.1 hypothetical protein AOBTE_LOCUS36728 [Acanthoscelides obtectus]
MTSRNKKTTRRQREDRPRSLIDDGVDAVCRKEEVAGTTHRSQVIGDLTSPAPLRSATQAQGQGRCDVSDFRVTSPLDVNSAPVIQSFSPAPALGARKGAFLDCPAVSSNQESQQYLVVSPIRGSTTWIRIRIPRSASQARMPTRCDVPRSQARVSHAMRSWARTPNRPTVLVRDTKTSPWS